MGRRRSVSSGAVAVRMMDGRPLVCRGRAPVPQAACFDRIMRGDWEDRVREFVDSGVKVFHLTAPHGGADYRDSAFWLGDGPYLSRMQPSSLTPSSGRRASYCRSSRRRSSTWTS